MSRAIVAELEGPYQRAFALLAQFIDVCPENVWAETNGGWPVWQQVAHAVAVLNFFMLEKDDDAFVPAPAELGVLMLREQGQQLVSKEAMKAYGQEVKAAVDARVARLADADLTSIQERVSKKIGRELSYGAVMVMLARTPCTILVRATRPCATTACRAYFRLAVLRRALCLPQRHARTWRVYGAHTTGKRPPWFPVSRICPPCFFA